jgi:hypothetical protein
LKLPWLSLYLLQTSARSLMLLKFLDMLANSITNFSSMKIWLLFYWTFF